LLGLPVGLHNAFQLFTHIFIGHTLETATYGITANVINKYNEQD